MASQCDRIAAPPRLTAGLDALLDLGPLLLRPGEASPELLGRLYLTGMRLLGGFPSDHEVGHDPGMFFVFDAMGFPQLP